MLVVWDIIHTYIHETILHVGVPLEADPVPVGSPGHDLDPADVGGHAGLRRLVLQVQGVGRGVCYCQPGYSGFGGSCIDWSCNCRSAKFSQFPEKAPITVPRDGPYYTAANG